MRPATFLTTLLLPGLLFAQTGDEVGGVPAAYDPPPPPDLARVCDDLPAGAMLEIARAGGGAVAGRWAGCDDRSLFLLRDGRRAAVPASDVLAIWVRERATGKGLTAGALVGGLGGGAFMGLIAMVLEGMDDDGAPFLPLVTVGVLGGGVAGGLVGAGVGSALPDWTRVYATPGTDPDRPDLAAARIEPSGFGRVSLLGGGAHNLGLAEDDRVDFAWRVGLRADTRRRFSYGLELGRYATGHAERPDAAWIDPAEPTSVWHAGGAARLGLFDGPIVPFLAGGLGWYRWDDSFLGWSLGAWFDLQLAPSVSWIVEYRYHANVQRLTETRPRLETYLAGLTVAW